MCKRHDCPNRQEPFCLFHKGDGYVVQDSTNDLNIIDLVINNAFYDDCWSEYTIREMLNRMKKYYRQNISLKRNSGHDFPRIISQLTKNVSDKTNIRKVLMEEAIKSQEVKECISAVIGNYYRS